MTMVKGHILRSVEYTLTAISFLLLLLRLLSMKQFKVWVAGAFILFSSHMSILLGPFSKQHFLKLEIVFIRFFGG